MEDSGDQRGMLLGEGQSREADVVSKRAARGRCLA